MAEEVVCEFFVSDMKIDREIVDQYIFRDIHHLPKSKKAKPEAPRPLIVAFVRQEDRNEVMRNAYQLKNSDHSKMSYITSFMWIFPKLQPVALEQTERQILRLETQVVTLTTF